jgi:hypothetical protein
MELGRFGGRYLDAPKKTDAVRPGWAKSRRVERLVKVREGFISAFNRFMAEG